MVKRLIGTLTVTAALLISACGDDGESIADSTSSPASDNGSVNSEVGDGGEADSEALAEKCEEGPDRKVTMIDDVTIPAFSHPEFEVDDEVIAGETIPGFVVPAVEIPEHTIEGGCIISYESPGGGCLGAVEITASGDIPDVEVPGYEVPAAQMSNGEVLYEGETVEGDQADGESIEGDNVEQECQQEPADGEGYVSSVYRSSLYRSSGYRSSLYRSTAYRPQICIGEDCTESVSVPSLSVDSVSVDSADYPSASLDSYTLEGTDAEVIDEEDSTAYLAPADVLFEFDEADLTEDALPTLEAIAAAIDEDFDDDAIISVEGHTDNEGETDYNQGLSEDRADAVASWLTENAGIDSDSLTTTGHGETLPVASNDEDEGRAQNRRVVITVTAAE
jgi:outer membrane protein OmpA-like peptidoglycan-associated protein